MASHNFIRNEVFDDTADRLRELTRVFVLSQRDKEYDDQIKDLETQQGALRAVALAERNVAAIDALEVRIDAVKREKREFIRDSENELRDSVNKWRDVDKKKDEDVITSDFTFNIPEHSLDEWIAKLRADRVQPIANVHFKELKDCLYKNTNAASYTEDEHDAGLAAKDTYFTGVGEVEENWDQEKANKAFERGCKNARARNAEARKQPQNWVLLKRAGLNDSRMEDTAIRYMDFQKRAEDRTPDWHAITRNLKIAGESVGYDERHYKHALDRLVSFFQPQLRPVTERMRAVELARFLLNLNVPDSEYDVIINQMRGLTRKAGERIQTVMSHLLALGNTMHKNLPEEEKTGKINTLMINGLLKFTTGQTKTSLAETVDDVNREQKKVPWEKFMTGVVKNESVHGYPTTALSYNEASGMTTRLFNVDTRAGQHVGTVGELVHQGLNLDEDYSLGRNTLLDQKPTRRKHDLDIASVEEKLRLRNIELEKREMLRQIAENRKEENAFAELRAAAEQRERIESEARRSREILASLARKSNKLSRSNLEEEEVFENATEQLEARRSYRERKQTDKYEAGGSRGASVNAFDTRQNFDRDRRQSQSPNRQRSGSYDSKEKSSRNDSRVDKERSQSDRSYKSSDRQSRQTSKEQYRPSRPDSRDRNSEKGRQSFDRQRSTSRDRQYSSSRNDRNDKSRASSYDSNKSKSYDSRQSRPADRASSYDRNRENSYDRNKSRSYDSRQSRPADRASS